MKRIRFAYLLTFLLALVFLCVGSSAYVIVSAADFSSNVGTTEEAKPVCYNTSTGVYYTEVEKGLEDANSGERINVLPGVEYTITENCEIKSGVTLNLMPNFDIVFQGILSFTSGSASYIGIQKSYDGGSTWSDAVKCIGTGAYATTSVSGVSYQLPYILITSIEQDGVAVDSSKWTAYFPLSSKISSNYVYYLGGASCKSSSTVQYYSPSVYFKSYLYSDNRSESYLGDDYYSVYCPSFSFTVYYDGDTNEAIDPSNYSKITYSSTSTSQYSFYGEDPTNYGANIHSSLKPTTHVATDLQIADGVTLTNNGTLYVGGSIKDLGAYSGIPFGNIATLTLKGTAKYISNGSTNVYGNIVGSSASSSTEYGCFFNSDSTTKIPLSIIEHRGGQYFVGYMTDSFTDVGLKLYLGKTVTVNLSTSPFNRFFCDSIKYVNYKYAYGASLIGFANLYANSQTNTGECALFSSTNSDSMIYATGSASYIYGRVDDDANCKYTYYGAGVSTSTYKPNETNPIQNTKNSLHIHGDFSLKPLSLSISYLNGAVKLSTKDVLLPVSHYFDVYLEAGDGGASADLTSQGVKILPGTNVYIGEGVKVNAASIEVYENSDFYPNGQYYAETQYINCSTLYPSTSDAVLQIDGSLTATNLGGNVTSSMAGASLSISTSNSVKEQEASKATSSSVNLAAKTISYYSLGYTDIAHTATGTCFNNLKAIDGETLQAGSTYTAVADVNDKIGFGLVDDTLTLSGADYISVDGAAQTYALSTSQNIGNRVEWSVSDETVATVSGDLLTATVTPVAKGDATLTASVYNGSSLVKSVSKTISVKGNSINVIAKDADGNQVLSTATDDLLTYAIDLTDYVTSIVSGDCTNSYKLPDYKVLRTVSEWSVTNSTKNTSSTKTSSAFSVSGSSGDTIIIEPKTVSETKFYLAYMTAHTSDGTSYLSTDYALDESNKTTTTARLDSDDEYCYIKVSCKYTLYAQGKNSIIGTQKTVKITDGSHTLTSNGEYGTGSPSAASGSYEMSGSILYVSSSTSS